MRFEGLLERWEKGGLSHGEAAAALGVSERTFRRWRGRFEDEGPDGLVDRRRGRPSPRRAPEDELARMLRLYHEHYAGFTVRHFHEKLVKRHGYKLGYTTTRLHLQRTGAVTPAPKRGAHRRRRPRRPMAGMLLHQDASPHAWLPGRPPLDLVITLDDATSAIYSAFLVEEEGTRSSLRGLAEVIARFGLFFMALYTDRASHYFHTPQAGGKISRAQLTQVGRALKQLGIEHIPAYSPEARGRCERAFRTLQDRLPKELALAGVTTRSGRPTGSCGRSTCPSTTPASRSPRTSPPRPSSRRPPEELWRDVLCVQEERRVGNDNCVRWRGQSFQVPPSPLRPHFVRATVRVHEYPDGGVALFKGPQRLADFPPVEAATATGRAA